MLLFIMNVTLCCSPAPLAEPQRFKAVLSTDTGEKLRGAQLHAMRASTRWESIVLISMPAETAALSCLPLRSTSRLRIVSSAYTGLQCQSSLNQNSFNNMFHFKKTANKVILDLGNKLCRRRLTMSVMWSVRQKTNIQLEQSMYNYMLNTTNPWSYTLTGGQRLPATLYLYVRMQHYISE